jgi:glycosyltransferase involved in cell wall biosynthesis
MGRVSVIIPGRNEIYFQQTIDSCLENATGDVEIIPVFDGYKPDVKITDKRVRPLFLEESIGQRAAYNLGVKYSTGEYVMKLDAHAIPSPGYDEILQSHCPDDAVVLPEMRRLDVNKWEHKRKGKTHFMYFGLDVFCHYWRDYKKRPAAKVEYPEVLTGQGSCWFTTRKWNDYIGLLDESLGSWGKVGIEISLKTWLCGGQQILNKKAWQAHWFRAGEGRFPYPLSGRQVGKARDFTWNNFFFKDTGAFPNQVRSFKWLMEKFAPIPGWEAYMVDEYK